MPMPRLAPILIAAVLSAGCQDMVSVNIKKRQDQAAEQKSLARKGELPGQPLEPDAELLNDVDKMGAELEARIDDWLQRAGGVVMVNDDPDAFRSFAVPAGTPWLVFCNQNVMDVTLGSWVDPDGSKLVVELRRQLLKARMTKTQCDALVPRVSRKLQAVVGAR